MLHSALCKSRCSYCRLCGSAPSRQGNVAPASLCGTVGLRVTCTGPCGNKTSDTGVGWGSAIDIHKCTCFLIGSEQ